MKKLSVMESCPHNGTTTRSSGLVGYLVTVMSVSRSYGVLVC